MKLLDFLDESEVWIENGNVVAQPNYFTTIWVMALAFSVFSLTSAFLIGTAYLGVFFGIGTGALFSWGVRKEVSRINSDRRQPHKVIPNIVDWEKRDTLVFSYMPGHRHEYIGVTDSFQIIVGVRKCITPVKSKFFKENEVSDAEQIRKKYKTVFTVPPLYVKWDLEKNEDYQERMEKRKKKNVISSKNRTYQEYLDTVSQEKKKLNGTSSA